MPRPSFLFIFLTLFVVRDSTARTSAKPDHSPAGTEVIREINLARQHPAVYAGYLEELRRHFQGNILVLPGHTMLRTREGVGAIDDAITFLHRTRPLAPLTASPGITMAAADHVADQASGAYGHNGTDHSNASDRMNRHGRWSVLWGENLSYGKSTARDIVLALIVDDGLRGRKHRKNIFNPTFNYAGAAVGSHARYRTVCSIDFAGGYVEGASNARSLFARN
jgi:uncharacterized protein YkwD